MAGGFCFWHNDLTMTSELNLREIGIIGESPALRLLACQIETAASCDLTALITGESGSGKELVARALHRRSARAANPFISLNCGALTETLMESELFGYERGAFTGAHQRHKGLFEAAHSGTIFLDEIAEMPPASQVKLLRVLQEGAVRPVGAHNEINIDVRVVAATNRNLSQEVSAGRFREDLFYRVAVLSITTPPLRDRVSDIPNLVRHFKEHVERKIKVSASREVEDDAILALQSYGWPGNIRQLRHVVERLVVDTCRSAVINGEAVRRALRNHPEVVVCSAEDGRPFATYVEGDSLDDFLDRTMLDLYDALKLKTGSHSEAARKMKVDRVGLYQRLERARKRLFGSATVSAAP